MVLSASSLLSPLFTSVRTTRSMTAARDSIESASEDTARDGTGGSVAATRSASAAVDAVDASQDQRHASPDTTAEASYSTHDNSSFLDQADNEIVGESDAAPYTADDFGDDSDSLTGHEDDSNNSSSVFHPYEHGGHRGDFHHPTTIGDFALSILGAHARRPRGPPMVIDLQDTQPTDGVGDDLAHQIDLTRSSGSEAEAESDGDDDEVAIIASTRPPAPPVPPTLPAPSHNTPTPRRRKRRRSSGDGSNSSNKTAMFDMQRAESTSVSLENNDVIEQFKRALKCSICLDVMEDMTSTICGHVYCCKCIRLAIRVTGKCPLCQRKLLPKDIHGLYF